MGYMRTGFSNTGYKILYQKIYLLGSLHCANCLVLLLNKVFFLVVRALCESYSEFEKIL